MKNILKKLLLNKFIAKLLIKPILKLHSFSYELAGKFAIILNNGIHPKHSIMAYKEWFVENIKDDWIVVDVGCNTGMMVEQMAKKAKYVYGIELEEKHINKAKKNIQKNNLEFICADATTYEYEKLQKIDCITLSNVLEHIENRVEFLKKLIKQVKWNDKKRLLIRVPMIDREWITIYKKDMGLEYRLDSTHFTEYTFEQFRLELHEANIDIQEYFIRFGEIYAVCEINE